MTYKVVLLACAAGLGFLFLVSLATSPMAKIRIPLGVLSLLLIGVAIGVTLRR